MGFFLFGRAQTAQTWVTMARLKVQKDRKTRDGDRGRHQGWRPFISDFPAGRSRAGSQRFYGRAMPPPAPT